MWNKQKAEVVWVFIKLKLGEVMLVVVGILGLYCLGRLSQNLGFFDSSIRIWSPIMDTLMNGLISFCILFLGGLAVLGIVVLIQWNWRKAKELQGRKKPKK